MITPMAPGVGAVPEPTPEERIASYRRTRDPDAMWPGTTDQDRVATYREMVRATRLLLAGQPAELNIGGEIAVRSAGVAAFMSGLGPWLGWWIERRQLRAPAAVSALLDEHLSHGRQRSAAMGRRLSRAVAALRERGVVPTVLKGAHTSRCYFEEPGSRPTGDIDILIRPDEAAATTEALSSLGLRKVSFHTAPYREDWGPVDHPPVHSADMTHVDNPWSVDLHYTLDRLYFPGLVASFESVRENLLEPWASPVGRVTVLRQPWLAAYLALHAAADFPHVPLIRIVELILVIRADLGRGTLTWEALAGGLRQLRLRRLAYPAFALAASLAPADIDPAFLAELADDTTTRMRHVVPMVLDTPHFSRLSFQVRLIWARGPREVLQNLADWIYPKGPMITGRVRLKIAWRRVLLLLGGRVGILPGNGGDER